jgi:hypothetical protein
MSRTIGLGGIGVLGFLDARGATELFIVLERAQHRYLSERGKRIEDAFLLVFGLVHLREWIAPGYKGPTPRTAAERFSDDLFRFPAYDVLRRFANQGKHQEVATDALPMAQGVHYGLIDDAPDFDAMLSMDDGPPVAYIIEGREAGEWFSVVLAFYEQRWFRLSLDERFS